MKKSLFLSFFFLLFVTSNSFAQWNNTINLTSGNLTEMKGQKININITYNNLRIGSMTEADFIKIKTDALNKKNSGEGDEWAAEWKTVRPTNLEPRLINYTNAQKILKKHDIVLSKDPSAKYTMNLNFDTIIPSGADDIPEIKKYSTYSCYYFFVVSGNIIETATGREVGTFCSNRLCQTQSSTSTSSKPTHYGYVNLTFPLSAFLYLEIYKDILKR